MQNLRILYVFVRKFADHFFLRFFGCSCRLEDANSANTKLVHNLELRDKKVESLEQR